MSTTRSRRVVVIHDVDGAAGAIAKFCAAWAVDTAIGRPSASITA